MDSKTALKLFSFGFLRMSKVNDEYTSEEMPWSWSCWYCAGSRVTRSVRSVPRGGPCSSGGTLPLKSFINLSSAIKGGTNGWLNTVFFGTRKKIQGIEE